MSINLNQFRRMLEAKRGELLFNAANRDEILIENAAEEFDRLQQQLNREVAIRNLRSSNSWFTIPVTYANRRATCVFFMEGHHHSLPYFPNTFE